MGRINRIGQKFGKLLVIAEASPVNGRTMWLCRCDCGNEKVIKSENLVSGNSTSCGCSKAGRSLKGQRFGYLVALSKHHSDNGSYWTCRCDCGKEVVVRAHHLISGHTKSCGCNGKSKSDVKRNNSLYHIWWNMIQRCTNPKAISYSNYGGRGIRVDERWMSFCNFKKDISQGYKEGFQLDRKDNNGDYCISNCRWVTPRENARNRNNNVWVTINGVRKIATDWSKNNVSKFLRKHQFDGVTLIEGGKYDNKEWFIARQYCEFAIEELEAENGD
jgi:hypothetical protein